MKNNDASRESPRKFVEAHRDAVTDEVWGIGALAKALETTPRAIRFYETRGLLSPRRVGNNRVYGRRERARLQLILRGKALGLSLRDMKRYLDLYGENGEGRRKQLTLVVERTATMIAELEAKRAQIDKTLAELRLICRESQKKLRALDAE